MGHGDSHEDEPREGDDDRHPNDPIEAHDDADDPGDDTPRGSPPHPLDRVWLHPSELPVGPDIAPAAAARTHEPSRAGRGLALVGAGAVGALIAVGLLAVGGALNRSSPSSPSSPATGATASPPGAIANAATLGLSMVAVTARDASGARRGSGICVRHGGEVLTTQRVIGNATRVDVVTSDGARHRARVLGHDRTTDLVLLSIDATVPAANLATHRPSAGSTMWIVGAPAAGSSSPWMSSGVLSSSDAVVTQPAGPWTGGLLETDAASSAPATGGALVDSSGAVAGIVLGHVDNGDTTFAVPIDAAVSVSEQLHDGGVAKHGSLGFSGVDALAGPTVTQIATGGPAQGAGVHVGDVVESVDNRPVDSVSDVMAVVRGDAPGTTITLELRRGANSFKVRVQLGTTTG